MHWKSTHFLIRRTALHVSSTLWVSPVLTWRSFIDQANCLHIVNGLVVYFRAHLILVLFQVFHQIKLAAPVLRHPLCLWVKKVDQIDQGVLDGCEPRHFSFRSLKQFFGD